MKSRLLVVTMATVMVIAMVTLANFGIGLVSAQTADNATTGNMTGGNMTSGVCHGRNWWHSLYTYTL